jgi:hypothetical protein
MCVALLQVAGDVADTWRAPLTQRLLELRSAGEQLAAVLTTNHMAPAGGIGPWNNPAQGGLQPPFHAREHHT